MNLLATVFAGPSAALPHVTWPIAPHSDESLAGFVDRTADHNGLRNSSALLADAGITRLKGWGRLARHTGDFTALTELIAAEPAWVRSRRHRTPLEVNSKHVLDFHGALLRTVHFDHDIRRAGQTAIQTRPYHREIWHISTLAACTETGELLLECCPAPGCAAPLAWSGHKRLGRCDDKDCPGTPASPPTLIPASEQRGLSLAAELLDPSPDVHVSAVEQLPACLRKENRGHLFDLAWILGTLDQPDGLKCARDPGGCAPLQRVSIISRGAERLLAWPECVTQLLRQSVAEDADTRLKSVVETIQAIVRQRRLIGRPADLLADQLEGISSNAFSTVVGRQLGLLTATQFARAVGLKGSPMAALQRSELVPRRLFSEGGRDIALFLPKDAKDLHKRIASRLPAQAFGARTGLGTDAVELLIDDGMLALRDDPVLQLLWPEHHLDPAVADRLHEQLEAVISNCPPPGAIRLSTALHGCPAGEKPWPAIIRAVLDGQLTLHRDKSHRLDIRRCLIGPDEVRTIRALRPPGACGIARSEWLSVEDARERLAMTPNSLRSLSASGRLPASGAYSGRTYRRSEVDALAADWVTITELREKLGGNTWLMSATLRAAGLSVDNHGLVSRAAARTAFGLATI